MIGVLAVPDVSASRRRVAKAPSNQATTETTTEQRQRSTTVTRDTQEAAKRASQSRSKTPSKPVPPKANDKKKLLKFEVKKPDLEEIRRATLDPKNKTYYYPNLMELYEKSPEKLTSDQYRYLYLGYMFQEDYDPYRSSPYAEKMEALRDKQNYTKEEIDTIRKYARLAYDDNPFDLRQISLLVRALQLSGKTTTADNYERRLENILGVIKSTGTGLDADNAWFVIYPVHEYDMVQLLGYQAVDIDYDEEGFDHLLVQPDGSVKINRPVSGFYFNVIMPQQQYELKHPEEMEDYDQLGADDDSEL